MATTAAMADHARTAASAGCASRDAQRAPWWLRPLARSLVAREARALRALSGVQGVPALLGVDGSRLLRSYLPGEPMQVAGPRDPGYFRRALRLLRQVHQRGVAHNDLARESNWLVLAGGEPGLIDFEIAWLDPRRGRLFRALAREDLRHLLKHKRRYCPARLTARQRRILAQPSPAARAWGTIVRPLARALAPGRRPAGGMVVTPAGD
jgi:RIO-like serine/threonine protein kinase